MGTRISLTVGLIGIVISFMLGMFFGGLAGYYGGWVDNVTQRVIEVIRSFPELPSGWRYRQRCQSHGAQS